MGISLGGGCHWVEISLGGGCHWVGMSLGRDVIRWEFHWVGYTTIGWGILGGGVNG